MKIIRTIVCLMLLVSMMMPMSVGANTNLSTVQEISIFESAKSLVQQIVLYMSSNQFLAAVMSVDTLGPSVSALEEVQVAPPSVTPPATTPTVAKKKSALEKECDLLGGKIFTDSAGVETCIIQEFPDPGFEKQVKLCFKHWGTRCFFARIKCVINLDGTKTCKAHLDFPGLGIKSKICTQVIPSQHPPMTQFNCVEVDDKGNDTGVSFPVCVETILPPPSSRIQYS